MRGGDWGKISVLKTAWGMIRSRIWPVILVAAALVGLLGAVVVYPHWDPWASSKTYRFHETAKLGPYDVTLHGVTCHKRWRDLRDNTQDDWGGKERKFPPLGPATEFCFADTRIRNRSPNNLASFGFLAALTVGSGMFSSMFVDAPKYQTPFLFPAAAERVRFVIPMQIGIEPTGAKFIYGNKTVKYTF
jgi:hypothetical protein